MNCRRHGSKCTIGLWMLIAVADVVLLAAAAGPMFVLLAVVGLVMVAGAFVAMRTLSRRAGTEPESAAAMTMPGPTTPANSVVRRRV